MWIALVCPQLSLDRILRRWPEALAPAIAVTRSAQARARHILLASPTAQAAGVRAGLTVSTALALMPELVLVEEDSAADAETLRELALCALRFTPQVVVRDAGLLLEVGASLSLFGGLDTLHAALLATLRGSGIALHSAVASTAQGAWLLARAHYKNQTPPSPLAAVLDALPLTVLDSYKRVAAVNGMGCRTIGDLRKLPRAGVAARFGDEVLAELDRALGKRADPQRWFVVPEQFSAQGELADATLSSTALLGIGTRLLAQLAGWLYARQIAIREFSLTLHHPSRPARLQAPSVVQIRLAQPGQDVDHFGNLLRERLERLELPAPVQSIKLTTGAAIAWQPSGRDLFTRPGVADETLGQLIEALQARLGSDAVTRVHPVDDHRPERALRIEPAHLTPRVVADIDPVSSPRPNWLLAEPLPLTLHQHHPVYASPLQLVGGPERIEAGWWDDAWSARDYYLAQNSAGCLLWIFRQRNGVGAQPLWFLHGILD